MMEESTVQEGGVVYREHDLSTPAFSSVHVMEEQHEMSDPKLYCTFPKLHLKSLLNSKLRFRFIHIFFPGIPTHK